MRSMRNLRIHGIITLFLFTVILSPTSRGNIIYVDDDGQADFDNIQAGIDAAVDGETVLVAPGEYVITEPITFKGKAIIVRSESGTEVTTIRMSDSPDDTDRASVIIFESGETETSVLDGFTITGGQGCSWNPALGYSFHAGGGIFCSASSPTITDCIISENHPFSQNQARPVGGGVLLTNSSAIMTNCSIYKNRTNYTGGGIFIGRGSPTLTDCIISQNTAYHNDGQAGGLYISGSSCKAYLLRCAISENFAPHAGGGIQVDREAQPTFVDCLISDNTSEHIGGILCSFSSETTLTNCIITRNIADRLCGGIASGHNGKAIVTNCTITANEAGHHSGGVTSYDNSSITLNNCIVFGNTAPSGPEIGLDYSYYHTPTSMNVSYCDIKGGLSEAHIGQGTTLTLEEGNIDADPFFADPNNGDYHLKSEMGRWDPNSESWIKDDLTSPCIDAGDPNSDFSGETWPHSGRINMGAYGGTHQASMSTETGRMMLPSVAYIFANKLDVPESFESLLEAYGCSTTLIKLGDVAAASFDLYDIIILANDLEYENDLSNPINIAAIEDSGKPIVGLGDGGYDFFGLLGLSIGKPYGGHGSENSIDVVDPNCSLFSTPYSIDIPQDRALQLYSESRNIEIYLWPTIPETVTVLGRKVDDVGYYPLVMEHHRYLLWGFTESPQQMTEVGKTLLINVVIWTANQAWESEN